MLKAPTVLGHANNEPSFRLLVQKPLTAGEVRLFITLQVTREEVFFRDPNA